MSESGTPKDRAEIAASEAVAQSERTGRGGSRRLCHQGRGGDEAFASAEEDVQDTGCFGRIQSETDRQQARARAERVNESTAGRGQVWGYFGRQRRVRWWSVKCSSVLGREGPDKVGGRQGKDERMDLADDLHEKGGNERARSPATLKCGSECAACGRVPGRITDDRSLSRG